MPNEITPDGVTDETQEPAEENAPVELGPIEKLAKSLGWKPKAEFDGDEERWTDADKFVAVRFDKVSNQFNSTSAKVKDLERTLSTVSEHISKVEKLAYDRAVAALKKEKREAVEAADTERVNEIDGEIDQLREAVSAKVETPEVKPNPEFITWRDKNSWYGGDLEMTDDADGFASAYLKNHKDAPPADVLSYVDKKIRKLYPEKFTNPKRSETPAVETGGSTGSTGTRKYTRSDLNDEQKKIHDYFVKTGDLTSEIYIQQLVDMGELGRKK